MARKRTQSYHSRVVKTKKGRRRIWCGKGPKKVKRKRSDTIRIRKIKEGRLYKTNIAPEGIMYGAILSKKERLKRRD